MAETTKISWCHSTWNAWIGCTKVAPECDNCYAADMDARKRWDGGRTHWGPGVPRYRTSASNWRLPIRWNALQRMKLAAWSAGLDMVNGDEAELLARGFTKPEPWRVFGGSLMDWADNEVDPAWRADYWQLIRDTPALTWLLLTKRAPNIKRMLPADFSCEAYPHVWLGTTAGTQARVDSDGMRLLEIDAAAHFLSVEPQLESLDLFSWLTQAYARGRRPWVINGGESGKNARPFAIDWARLNLAVCRAQGAPFFMKQLGAHVTWGGYASPGEHWPDGTLKNDTGRGHFRVMLKDRAGANPDEWPEDIRIREFPQ